MLRVFVLDKSKEPLMPTHPARARKLLKRGKAKVFRRVPFTIMLTEREGGTTQELEHKVDPGSKTTGIALVAHHKNGKRVVFALNLEHRGQAIKDALESRRAIRRSRRSRKTRYRKPRFLNRTRPKGWLPPSLKSRVQNIVSWTQKLTASAPITSCAVETVRFDTQKMQDPEISGTEYQQGELQGYEVREYLLEKWNRKCAYCGATNRPLEVEHIVAKSNGGSNRVSNLTLACKQCNVRKGNSLLEDFVKEPQKRQTILRYAKQPLKDAAAVNATRYAVGTSLKALNIPISFWSGGRTKYNRCRQGYRKDHWIDAACVGLSGESVFIHPTLYSLQVKAEGRGSRQMCRVDRFGFPRTKAKSQKRVGGFATGDLVKAIVTHGKKKGVYTGRVAVRATGNFNIKQGKTTIQGIHRRYCTILQRADGYSYTLTNQQKTERPCSDAHASVLAEGPLHSSST